MRRTTGIALAALATTMVTATTPGMALAADAIVPTAVDLAVDGVRPNDRATGGSSLSGDGHYVAFSSFASNLVSDDRNGRLDVFVRNTASSGAVEGDWSGGRNVYVRDRRTGVVTPASHGTTGKPAVRDCLNLALSADGRQVTFVSNDGTLVAGDTDREDNVFLTTVPN